MGKVKVGTEMAEINTNSTMMDCTAAGEACKRDWSKLPKICYFRIQSRNKVGAIKSRHERSCGAWALLVSCDDHKGLRLASDVGYEYGMVFKCEFKDRESAISAGKDYQAKWGVAKPKAEPKPKKSAEEKAMELLAKAKGLTVEQVKAALG